MNNRLGLGLAVGAGYLLGRTKKAKLAFGIGTLVMGKRLQLSPRAIADFAAAQLADNPQFKEIGDQMREDLRGVGKAATGALLNRQIEGIADRLHDRTLDVQDRISGVVPDVPGSAEYEGEDESEDESEDEDGAEAEGRVDEEGKASAKSTSRSPSSSSSREGASSKSRTAGRASAKSPSSKAGAAKKTAKSVQRTAKRAPVKKSAGRRSGQGGEGRD